MCPVKHWFTDLVELDGGIVFLGNDEGCKVKGTGSIKIRMFDGRHKILRNVRYVPELKKNLISLGSLNALGYEFNTDHGFILVTRAGNTVMKGKKVNGLHTLI